MKRHIIVALVYAVLAMVCGVFYREFSKAMDFTGVTALGKLHVHLFVLGMVVFLLVALFDEKFGLQKHKLYIPFMATYNAGIGIMCIMLWCAAYSRLSAAKLPTELSPALQE